MRPNANLHPELSGGNAARDALSREAASWVTLDSRLPRLRARRNPRIEVARRIWPANCAGSPADARPRLIENSLCLRACTHKSRWGDSDLINVRFGPLCGLKSDIPRGPRSAMRRHSPLTTFQIAPVIRPPIQAPLLHGWELNDAATLWELQIASDAMSLDA